MEVGRSDGFLPLGQVKAIDITTSLGDVLAKIEGDASGFVLSHSGKSQGYVSAQQIVSNLVEPGSWITLQQRTIFDLVRNPAVNLSMIQVAEQTVAPDADLAVLRGSAKVVVKVEQNGMLSGYLLPKEMRSEIHTIPRLYKCSNPVQQHPNSQSGRSCRICPFPVLG